MSAASNSDPVSSGEDVSRLPTPAQRVGRAKTVFDAIRLPYPLQEDAVSQMDEVRWAAKARDPSASCSGAVLIAPTGVGKSEACKALVRRAAAEVADGEDRIPVLHVSLAVDGTTGSVPTAILQALRDPRPDLGKEFVRWRKVIDRLKARSVEMILFDEFNRASRRPTMSAPIALSIREHLLDPGVCPVVIVGSESAGKVLENAPALLEVLDEQIDLDPLDWEDDGDKAMFREFLGELDARLVAEKLLRDASSLSGEDTAYRLWEASAGRVRRLMKIVRFALGTALHAGAPSLRHEHLGAGVQAYAVRAGYIDSNPFGDA